VGGDVQAGILMEISLKSYKNDSSEILNSIFVFTDKLHFYKVNCVTLFDREDSLICVCICKRLKIASVWFDFTGGAGGGGVVNDLKEGS